MSKFFNKISLMAFLSFIMLPSMSQAATLNPGDLVGISFWVISIAMVAATVFFLWEAMRIGGKWSTSLTVAALVTLIAAVHYFYMRDIWVASGDSPTVYRYVDWILTVPLQMVEFYLILAAVGVVAGRVFWHLLIGTLIMLLGGYFGETGVLTPVVGFVVGMTECRIISCSKLMFRSLLDAENNLTWPLSRQIASDIVLRRSHMHEYC